MFAISSPTRDPLSANLAEVVGYRPSPRVRPSTDGRGVRFRCLTPAAPQHLADLEATGLREPLDDGDAVGTD